VGGENPSVTTLHERAPLKGGVTHVHGGHHL
jgi:hypothetical protein